MSSDRLAKTEGRFRTGPFQFESGEAMDSLDIAYWTMGELNPSRDNAILLCHGASGDRNWADPFVRPGGAFDPSLWFIISVDAPGGGKSSRRRTDPSFPAAYTTGDLAAAFTALVEGLGITSLRAFCGPSMAGFMGLDMACRKPGFIRGLGLWTGGYRCDGFGQAVIAALEAVLDLDASDAGLHAAATLFAPMALGRGMVARMSVQERGAMIDRVAEGWRAAWRPDELVARYKVVAGGDVATRHGGLEAMAKAVGCPVLWLVAASDNLITPTDLAGVESFWPDCEVQVIDTGWGHLATIAPPGSPEFDFFDKRTAAFLAKDAA